MVLAFALLAGCGGGGGSSPPTIHISTPVDAASFSTTGTGIRIGGEISRASFVHVRNAQTGTTVEGYVFYNMGHGSWFADVYGLVPGSNTITAIADADGTGARTASDQITVLRPDEPMKLVFNGADRSSATTYWTDASSAFGSHKIALFADGTGRSTTGSTLSDPAGAVADFIWVQTGPDSLAITNCPTCSFQSISRISGSFSQGSFYGEVHTVGNAGDGTTSAFTLTSGNL